MCLAAYFLFCLNVCLMSDHQTLRYNQGQTTMSEYINNDIVVVLCSKLPMRWSYYIHQAYRKKFSTLTGIEPGTSAHVLNHGSYHIINQKLGTFELSRFPISRFPISRFPISRFFIEFGQHNLRKTLWHIMDVQK